jgi:hypothetical protein
MLKVALALVLLAHGIGHSMGLLQVFKVAQVNPQWQGDSWVLTSVAGTTATQVVGIVLWTVAMIGFAGVAGVVVGWLPATWWQPLAVGSALLSLVGLLVFPTAFPTFSTIGAAAIDIALLVAVLRFAWTPADLAA